MYGDVGIDALTGLHTYYLFTTTVPVTLVLRKHCGQDIVTDVPDQYTKLRVESSLLKVESSLATY